MWGGGVDYDIEHCHFFNCFFLPNLQLNIGKKYLKTVKIIDESLILAIVLGNYSAKPSYMFQLKRELKAWKYIFNLFHFVMLIQNRIPKFRPCVSLFWLVMNTRPVLCLVFGWIINCSLFFFFFLFFLFWCQVVCVIIYVLLSI